jgi:hypothetical protein
MVYVEFLRARKLLTWHLGILAVITLLVSSLGHDTSISVNGAPTVMAGTPVPLGALAPIAMFFAAIYATSAGTSLNRENLTRDLSWTKPRSRTFVALQFVLVDVAAIALVFALTTLAVLAVLWRLHFIPVAGATLGPDLALGLGVAVMWYALIQVLTCSLGPGARAISGILWPVAFVGLGLSNVPGALGVIARAFDVINPLAYMNGVSGGAGGVHQISLWPLPVETRALVVWLFAALFCAIAVALWPRQEA